MKAKKTPRDITPHTEHEERRLILFIVDAYKTLIELELSRLKLPTDADSLWADHIEPKIQGLSGHTKLIYRGADYLDHLVQVPSFAGLKDSVYLLWRALTEIQLFEALLFRGDFYFAMLSLHSLTFFATKAGIEPLRADAEIGQKVRQSGKDAMVKAFGDAETVKARHAEWQAMADKFWQDNPKLSHRAISQKIAKQYRGKNGKQYSPEAIRKNTRNPKTHSK